MREHDLYEASYGSNADDFSDGKVQYIPEKRAFALASKVSNDLFLVVLLYTDGRVLMSTTKAPDVFNIVVGSIEQIMNPINVNTAYKHYDQLEKMLKAIVDKFYSRLDRLQFISVDSSDLEKLNKFIKRPKVAQYLEVKKFEFVEQTKIKGLNVIIYDKQ